MITTARCSPVSARSVNFARYHSQYGVSIKNLEDALGSFNHLLSLKPMPSVVEFTKLLGAVVRMKHYSVAISLIKQLESTQITVDVYVLSMMINCFCHLNKPAFAFSVLGKILKLGHQPNSTTFTTLMKGLFLSGEILEAVQLFDKMLKDGYEADVIAYGTVIDGLCKIEKICAAIGVLRNMEKRGCKAHAAEYSTIIHSLCKVGELSEARCLVLEMASKGISLDVVTYNSLIHGNLKLGHWEEAKKLLREMKDKGVVMSVAGFNVLVGALCKDGMMGEAEDMIKIMVESGVQPDTITYNTLMNGYCLQSNIKKAEDVFKTATSQLEGRFPSTSSYNILIHGFCKSNRKYQAMSLMEEMSQRGLIHNKFTFDALIGGLASRPRDCLALFIEMRSRSIFPDVHTYGSFLDGLFKSHLLKEAMVLFKEIESIGFSPPSIVIYNIYMDGMCRAGNVETAVETFIDLSTKKLRPDVVTYNIMISGLCEKGLANEAFDMFDKMECSPNRFTFNIIIRGLLKNNDMFRAKQLLHKMVKIGFSFDDATSKMLLDLKSCADLDESFLEMANISISSKLHDT